MRLLSKNILALALAGLLVGPALAQRSSPPSASQVTPSRLDGPQYRTPDVARSIDVNRDPVGPSDRMTNRLQTRSLGELDRWNRTEERPRDVRRLEVAPVPEVDWRLGLTAYERLRLAEVSSRFTYERENIPTMGRLRKDDNLTSWRDYIGQVGVRGYDVINDSRGTPPPGLRGPTPAPGGRTR